MSKGSRRERECVALWKRAGFAVYRPATVQYGENDVFGLFDVLAISPRHESVHAIQVKSNHARGIAAWGEHTNLFRRLGFRTFYAVPVDREGWRILECLPASTETCVDERDSAENIGERVVEWLEEEAIES